MKILKNLIVLFLLASATVGNAQTKPVFKNAVEFNDFIVDRQTKIGERITELIAVMSDPASTFEEAEQIRLKAIDSIKLYIAQVENLSWQGDNSLPEVTVRLFKFYQTTFENEYSAILVIVYKPEVTAADNTELDRIVALITEKEKVIDAEFSAVQTKFANANDFELIQEETEQR